MEYQVIARKWRPQTFKDVVGQEHITRTLANAIIQQRTAHAYLFVGPRGIGKTSSARIFAKALNCMSPINGEPCCECASCISIAANNCMDIIEIDAASNNSVGSMRELCDEVMYAPVSSKYKIYIIDEVHMLTAASWNALLKTVEEPPEHVKFIFATTEVHKVLPTILSRCQRFDLRRIPSSLICERLRFICDTEKVPISDGALSAIARAADGGMRDAQSLLDQMISFFSASADSQISEDQVLSLFGLTASVEMEDLVHAILVDNKGGMITNIYQLANKGKDLEKLLEEVMSFLRGIQICQILPDPSTVIESGAESVAQYQRLAQAARPGVVQRLLEVLSPVGYTLHNALNKQVYLETILLKSMRVAHAAQANDIITRLNQIRKNGELEVVDRVPTAQSLNVELAGTPVQAVVPTQPAAPVQPAAPAPQSVSQPEPAVQPAAPAPQSVSQPEAPVAQVAQPVVDQPQGEGPVNSAVVTETATAVGSTTAVQAEPVPSVEVAQAAVVEPAAPEASAAIDEDDVPPWKVEEPVAADSAVAMEEPQLIDNFSKSDEVGILPVVEAVEQQIEVQEEIQNQQAPAVAPGGLTASIPSVDSIAQRDESLDSVNPLEEAMKEEQVACHCVEDNTVLAAESADVVTEEGTLSPYPGDTVYEEPCAVENAPAAEAPQADFAYIDFDSISDATDAPAHFDEVEHMNKLRERAAANPLVSATMDLFGGTIVDVHTATTDPEE